MDAEGDKPSSPSSAGVYMVYSEGRTTSSSAMEAQTRRRPHQSGGWRSVSGYYIAAVFEDEQKQVYLNSNLLALSPTPGGTPAGGSGAPSPSVRTRMALGFYGRDLRRLCPPRPGGA